MFPLASVFFLLFAVALLVAVGVYNIKAAQGAASLGAQDAAAATAHKFATWGAVAAILGATLIIVLAVLYMIFGSESAEVTLPTVTLVLLIITLLLIFLSGVLSAVAASHLSTSTGGSATTRHEAYSDAIIAAVIGIVGFVALTTFLIIQRVHAHRAQQTPKGGNINDLSALEMKMRALAPEAEMAA